MKKADVIEALEELAMMLDVDGANSFRVSAHTKAARALSKFDGDLDAMAQEKKLTEIDGVGKGIAEKIHQLYDNGFIEELKELHDKYPDGLPPMLQISGFGAKKVRVVYDQLGVTSIDELRTACEDGRVAKLKGFGKKTADNIIKGIDQLTRFSGQHRLDVALNSADDLLTQLKDHKDVIKVEVCGSLRRSKEIVKDLDFVVATKNAESVMKFFTGIEGVESVVGSGSTKTSIRLRRGIQADLRCVEPEQFPFAMLHFTGSKEHNTRLRQLAKEKDLKLNEYGLFPDGSETSKEADSEQAIYKHLGLVYISPELREDRGEVEAAAKNDLPKLLERSDLLGVLHLHTHYSDGKPEVEEYAKWASENDIKWMGLADHSQSLTVANGLSEERVLKQFAEIDAVNTQYKAKGVRLLKGIESDILEDGSLDYREDFLKEFEYIVASVHSHFNLSEGKQTRRIIKAMESPYTTVLGHMTGRLILQRDGYAIDAHEVIRKAAEFGVAIEINANPRRLDIDWRLIPYALEQGCKLTIGPDAHIMSGLEDIEFGIKMARKGWVQPSDLLNCLSVDDFLAFASKRKG